MDLRLVRMGINSIFCDIDTTIRDIINGLC